MKNGYIYKTIDDDVAYCNNAGKSFILTEAKSPIGNSTYDIVVAFSVTEDAKCEYFDMRNALVWWFGASDISNFFEGKENDLLDACHSFLDERG